MLVFKMNIYRIWNNENTLVIYVSLASQDSESQTPVVTDLSLIPLILTYSEDKHLGPRPG